MPMVLKARRGSRVSACVAGLVCVCLLAPASGTSAPRVLAAAAPEAGVERAIRECANRNRRAAGLEPLQAGRALSKAARLQARNMARYGFFDHTDPWGRGPGDRVEIFDRAHRYNFIGENIAAGYTSTSAACNGWMNSPGHRANILGESYTAIGGGFFRGGDYGRYYVQVFAKAGPLGSAQ